MHSRILEDALELEPTTQIDADHLPSHGGGRPASGLVWTRKNNVLVLKNEK